MDGTIPLINLQCFILVVTNTYRCAISSIHSISGYRNFWSSLPVRVTKKSTRNARHWQVAIPEAPWPEIPSSQRHDVPMIRCSGIHIPWFIPWFPLLGEAVDGYVEEHFLASELIWLAGESGWWYFLHGHQGKMFLGINVSVYYSILHARFQIVSDSTFLIFFGYAFKFPCATSGFFWKCGVG